MRRFGTTHGRSSPSRAALKSFQKRHVVIPAETRARYPSIAWKDMAGAGNIYRHDYEDVAAKLVWDTVQLALPPLRDDVVRELADLE
jgi:uncharacterized protein with HEPN domain